MKLDEKAVNEYSNFDPPKASVDAAEIVEKSLGSNGTVVDNWGKWLDEQDGKVLSKLGISTHSVPTNTVVILIGHKPDSKTVSLRKVRQKAVGVQLDPKSSAADVSNAWHAVFVFEEEYRQRQITLGLWPTNAPHPIFSPTGWNGDGSPAANK
jgi:hypothetical protein